MSLIPPANEVFGKVMFSQMFVCPQGCLPTGVSAYMGCLHPGVQGVSAYRECLPTGSVGLQGQSPSGGRGSAYRGSLHRGGGRGYASRGLGRSPRETRKASGTHLLECFLVILL